ncbi:hypothetical protein FC52_GL000316 [Lactobacillus pasteurii DSM 23907 = CRBIP 24.76]|uniref:Putative N-acetylmuramidase n=1 Tax=Lactobacillus pasteurii DSM 23907 = CRBIP 24.76 TaxID=1423790 RepID=I7KLF2_9LACO|nr:SAG1386/EF1546 family surface-associated protein [Lactobacillus pasteurii]KRK08618.1 hypothetical protein FC52_GL000316 [Lactobacillus pasteurii DSM 23907 = CRBIP 24.76]TDG76559.1 hypothetical protein C5L33_001318 [Lactobacillus pasteurii]CCI85349.1 Putative N-acetylmuramidase [Lactobacillus pasteurii DSM 23907 = CRBIP 24.76]
MDNHPKGPYKHFERPDSPRLTDQPKAKNSVWSKAIIGVVIVLIALVPVVYHFAKNNRDSAKVYELEKTSKSVSSKKHVSKKKSTQSKASSTKTSKSSSSSKKQSSSSAESTSSSSSESSTYVVQPGDTLSGIAQKNGMTVSRLAELNGITDASSVEAGQTLKLK